MEFVQVIKEGKRKNFAFPMYIALDVYSSNIVILASITILSTLIVTHEAKAQDDFSYNNILKKEIEKGVWLYTGDFSSLNHSMVDNLILRDFNTIYFSTTKDDGEWDNRSKSEDYRNFIDYARSKDMKIFGVTLESPIYIFKTELDLRAEFGDFINHTKDIFDSYMIDVEPHTKTGFFVKEYPPYEENKCMYLNKYVNMSKILRSVADEYHVRYIDTIPSWYHEDMKQCKINGGIDSLSSHSTNLMTYTSTVGDAIHDISSIMREVTKPYVISIKVTDGQGDETLKEQDIPVAISTLAEENSLPMGMYEAKKVLQIPFHLFTGYLN
jgi:hypothetical protein